MIQAAVAAVLPLVAAECPAGAERPEVGEVGTVIPNHACGCTNMHDEVVVHRQGRIVGSWPVAARGKLR